MSRRRSASKIKRVAWEGKNKYARGVGSALEEVEGSLEKIERLVMRVKKNIVLGILREMSWFGQIARK